MRFCLHMALGADTDPILLSRADELARVIVEQDLKYSDPVTAQEAAEYADPEDVVYRFRKRLGHLFEDEM